MRETYKVTVEDEGSNIVEIIVGIIVLAIILFICVQCSDSSSSKSGQETEEGYVNVSKGVSETLSNEVSVVPDRMALTDLYVFEEVGSVYISEKSIQNAYGTVFDGPYLDLWSLNHYDDELECYTGYVEFVTGRNYRYFSGTYFADGKQEPGATIQLNIYADDVLIYTSGEITRETEPIDFTIEITNCNILRVEIRTTDYYEAWGSASAAAIQIVNGEVYN